MDTCDLKELEARLVAMRDEYDSRYGDAWPADVTQAFEAAVKEFAAAVEAAQRRQQLLAAQRQAQEQMRDVLTQAQQPRPPRAADAQAQQQPAQTTYRAALRAFLLSGAAAVPAASRQWLTAASIGETGEAFIVPEPPPEEIVQARRRGGVIRQFATVRRASGSYYPVPTLVPGGEYPSQITPVTGGTVFSSETQALDPVRRMQFEPQRIQLHPWTIGTVIVPREIQDDAGAVMDLEAEVLRLVETTRAVSEDRLFVRGDGSAQPLGIVTDPRIQTATTGAATGLTYDGLVNALVAVRDVYIDGATWLMHPLTVGQLLKLKDSQNRPLFAPGQSVSELFGRPLVWMSHFDTPASDAIVGAFGDMSQYYIVDRYPGLELVRLRERYAPHTGIAAWTRLGGQCVQPEAIVKIKQAA